MGKLPLPSPCSLFAPSRRAVRKRGEQGKGAADDFYVGERMEQVGRGNEGKREILRDFKKTLSLIKSRVLYVYNLTKKPTTSEPRGCKVRVLVVQGYLMQHPQ